VLLDPARVLRGQRRLGDAEGERQRAAARDDVRDDRDVVAGDLLEDQDREPAPPLVLEDQRHHIVVGRDRLPDVNDFVGVGLRVRGDEAPEVLAHARS